MGRRSFSQMVRVRRVTDHVTCVAAGHFFLQKVLYYILD